MAVTTGILVRRRLRAEGERIGEEQRLLCLRTRMHRNAWS